MRKRLVAAGVLVLLAVVACGPSEDEMNRLVDERIEAHLRGLPTVTPQPTATPQPTPTPYMADFREVHARSRHAVFLLQSPSDLGTGWLLEPGLIVTNEHVVRELESVTARQGLGPPFTATVVAVDSVADVALLAYSTETAQVNPSAVPLPLGDAAAADIALPLVALGYSGLTVVDEFGAAGPASANTGVLTNIARLTMFPSELEVLNLVIDIPIDSGDSGGPVLTPDGLLVGMVRSESIRGGVRQIGTNYAVHVDEIRKSLVSLRQGISR